MTTGAWRWVDAAWSNDWRSQTSQSAPYHCSMCSSEKGKGKAGQDKNQAGDLSTRGSSEAHDVEPRGWTWEEAEAFAKVCESMVEATPKFKAKPNAKPNAAEGESTTIDLT